MNRYQKQRSKEIKKLLKCDCLDLTTYSKARRHWNRLCRMTYLSPCDYCCNNYDDVCYECKTKTVIAYCPNLLTVDVKLIRALKLLPQGITTK